MQRKVDWVDAQRCRARRTAHGWVESWSRGQKSQRASSACSGGVSAVMGTSDFDAHTFAQHSSFAIGVKAHCPLKPKPPTVETACLADAIQAKRPLPVRTGRDLANTQSVDTI
jgi:hypothetical protein